MKKIVISISMFVILLGCTASAQNNIPTTWDTLTITPNISEQSVNDINHVGMKFCNDGLESDKLTNQLHMQLQPGQRQEICAIFYSRFTDKTVKIAFWFTEWTKRSDGMITCKENTNDNAFSHMIQTDPKNFSFDLSTGEQSLKTIKMAIPTTATGTIYGCLSYTLPAGYTKNTGDIFGVEIRKVGPIEINITWNVYKLWWRDDIKDVYTTNKSGILKIIIAILALWLIITIFKTAKTTKKEEKHHTTHNTKEKHHTKK